LIGRVKSGKGITKFGDGGFVEERVEFLVMRDQGEKSELARVADANWILTGILGCTWVQRNYRGELAETEGVRDIEGCLQGRNAAPIPTARITKTHRKVFI